MDLSYGEKYEAFRAEVRGFIATNRDRSPAPREVISDEAKSWQKLLIEHGYTARTIPKEYGGYGAQPDLLELRIITEEFTAAQIPLGIGGQGLDFLVPTLLETGTEEHKKRFIPPTLTGDMLWCQGYSEPNAGSDLSSLQTRGVLDGDEWVVNGQKIWTSTAMTSDWMFCLVRTEPDARNSQAISFLLFSMDTPGIDVRPLMTMTGDATFNEVFFTDVRVPKDQIVGARGQGWAVANSLLRYERGALGDPNLMQARLNALIELMKDETVDGERVIDNPVFRDRLMKIQGEVMAMRYNDLRLLSARINNDMGAMLAGMIVKLQGTELRHELEGLAVDALGELGILYRGSDYLRDGGMWQHMYMMFLGLIIGGGTNQIQKNIISERGLGMPREPRAVQS